MTGQSAVIFGATGGIGKAIADELEAGDRFDRIVRFSRSGESPVSVDLSSEESIRDAAAWLADKQIAPSLVFVATGLLHDDKKGPEKSLRQLDADWLLKNYQVNAIGPALIAKHFLPLMDRNEIIRFAALSARVGSISDNRLGGWYGYRASKAALNMMIRNLSIEWSRKNEKSIIVALHPGTVDTALSVPFQGNVAPEKLFDSDRAARQLLDVLEALKPADSGKIFSWDGTEIQP
ncbi:MAG: SDR family NAD(P)-dependent oxidoreductase [Sphingomonadales bacterium]|nr:SDR family NAD(P)-dependent oxidoreductase [Sphingomonadales bacterium]PIX67713.1 MAG: short-chain dehydrogenase [Sphingomonadales bacterium CG_4_10_14_3_um_filter_58_15]NCO47999.1 SDR family NAD(P)-dependent oxidoreductase [Sphingomonadales bacterium]NCO98875.1 SDR family NAD(P)-dependent oxidoreductase [Sphingomonadales bacterium]NCP28217.1 SDR family NAD(P)-dependent oxidoreductase [Sphingomonadales bacterium]